jgi:hypothetical protein
MYGIERNSGEVCGKRRMSREVGKILRGYRLS